MLMIPLLLKVAVGVRLQVHARRVLLQLLHLRRGEHNRTVMSFRARVAQSRVELEVGANDILLASGGTSGNGHTPCRWLN